MARRYELSDAQWEAIRGELPGKAGDPGRTAEDNRRFVDAVLYVAKTGIPWPDLPERFGKPNTIWKRFDRWCRAGVWERLARVLGDPDLDELQLDSTTVKADPVASTGRRRAGEKKEDADARRCLGRSRGGLTTKLHACVDAKGRVVRLRLTAGQCGDAPQALPLLAGYRRGRIGCVIADAAYDGDDIRRRVRSLRARTCIKPNPTRKVKRRYDRRRYKHRNLVERFFGAIKRFRRVATRYEKKAENYLGFVWLAAVLTGMG